jgi:aminopeptidase
MNPNLITIATQNVRDILQHSIKYDPALNKALVVYDTDNELTNILTAAYRAVLPDATFVDFATMTKDEIIAMFDTYNEKDLVVMLQSSSFRLDDFRIRIHLFKLKLKVIEHLHLYRNGPETWESYINSISYDKDWYHTMGPWLQTKLSQSQKLVIRTQNNDNIAEIIVRGDIEMPKLNTGDYTGMENIGGTFPIGEVFTEAKVLESMNGSFYVYAFADAKFEIIMPEPFRIDITEGQVSGWSDNVAPEFLDVIAKIKEIERPIIREIGFGLNRAMQKDIPLGDITAFERIVGVHLSLGEKHSVYKKEGISAHKSRFHVDLFLQTKQVLINGETIFENGEYKI